MTVSESLRLSFFQYITDPTIFYCSAEFQGLPCFMFLSVCSANMNTQGETNTYFHERSLSITLLDIYKSSSFQKNSHSG